MDDVLANDKLEESLSGSSLDDKVFVTVSLYESYRAHGESPSSQRHMCLATENIP